MGWGRGLDTIQLSHGHLTYASLTHKKREEKLGKEQIWCCPPPILCLAQKLTTVLGPKLDPIIEQTGLCGTW